jgi:LAS superfamily LD-carboxypeptidase LdcB
MNDIIQLITEASLETLLLSVSVIMLCLNIMLLIYKKNTGKQTEIVQSLQRDLRALTSAAVGMGGRVMEIERQQRLNTKQQKIQVIKPVAAATQLQPQPQPVSNSSSSQYYDHAIRMVQQGAKTEDIEQACGLSKSEAELISIMHRLDKTA